MLRGLKKLIRLINILQEQRPGWSHNLYGIGIQAARYALCGNSGAMRAMQHETTQEERDLFSALCKVFYSLPSDTKEKLEALVRENDGLKEDE